MKKLNRLISLLILMEILLGGCAMVPGVPQQDPEEITKEKEMTESHSSWKITQYGSDDGSQYMFYTIESNDGRFVIIDGGYTYYEDLVRSVIEQHNNHVTAWIITHPHPDHVGAFNRVIAGDSQNKITIDTIYTVPVNKDRYKETAASYDDYPSYETFLSLIASMENIVYLHEGDEMDLIGLRMKVLHSWDEQIDTLSSDLCNNGSMVFKLYGKKDSMLFCADVESPVEAEIIAKYENELKSDYVQCAHHGNWGLSVAFYDLVSPKAAFMDAPSVILDEENYIFDAYLLRNYFIAKQIPIYRFTTAPNEIVLQ